MWDADHRSKRWGGRFSAAVLLCVLWAVTVLGQGQTSGRISGKIVDDAGRPVSGATVTAANKALSLERTVTTPASGEFVFGLLPTGEYDVTVTAEGKQPEVYNVRLGIGETIPLTVQMAPGAAVAESITVSADASALETTTIGSTFKYSTEVEALPIINRDIESVASLAPNMSFGPTGGTLSIAGAPSFDTTVLLDGAEISDPYFGSAPDLYLEDAIEELQVLTSGVSARYGRFQGGVINAITKSGTNDFEGAIRAELESQGWNGGTPYGEDRSTDVTQEYQATLGGPVIRDRIWFFGGLWTAPSSESASTTVFTDETVTTKYSEDRWHLKLRGALTPSHLIDGSYFKFDSESLDRQGLAAGHGLALGARKDPRTTQTLGYQGVFGPETFVELQAMRKRVKIFEGGDPNGGDPFIDYNFGVVFNNGWWDFSDPSIRDNDTLAVNVNRSLSTGRFGTHSLEAGFQRVNSITGGENRQSATGYNLLALNTGEFYNGLVNGVPTYNIVGAADDPLTYRWKALSISGKQELLNNAFYVQDAVTFNKVRLDLGLRFDAYDGSGPIASYNLDFSGWQPRVGLTYSVTPRWQVQVTYGRYVSRFNDGVANNTTGISSAPRIEHLYTGPTLTGLTADQLEAILRDDSNWGVLTAYVGPDQPTTFQATNIEAPYADDYNLSIRHGLPRNTGSVVLSWIHRDYKNLIDDFAGGVCDYGIDFGVACPAGNITTIVDPETGAPLGSVDTTIWGNYKGAKRKYRALTGVWEYRPSTRWFFGGNYTLGWTKGNYEGEAGNQPASGSLAFGNYERSIDLAAAAPYGYTDDDIRHRLITQAAYTFDFQRLGLVSLGSSYRYQSGRAYSLVAAVPRTPDPDYLQEGEANYNYFFGPNGEADRHERGSRRFDGYWALDLSMRYEVPVLLGVRPFVRLAVTNVLNNDAVTSFQTNGRALRDASGTITGWAPLATSTCGLDDAPSKDCTSFGRIRNERDYQPARAMQFAVGIQF